MVYIIFRINDKRVEICTVELVFNGKNIVLNQSSALGKLLLYPLGI